MNRLKRSLAVCLALAICLTLAACGAKGDTAASGGSGESKPETTTPAAPGSDGPSQPEISGNAKTGVTMKVAAMTGPTGMGLAGLLDRFGVVETLQDEPLAEGVSPVSMVSPD